MEPFRFKTAYIDEQAVLQIGRYADGEIALALVNEWGELLTKATVCLAGSGRYPQLGNVFVKNYAENAGVLEALIEAGVIGPPVAELKTGYVSVYECPLLLDPSTIQEYRR